MGKLTRTRVLHVESGLRSFSLRHPFPEELNRLIAFRLSDAYACPGEWAVANLARYSGVKLNTEANTQVDTLRFGLAHAATADVERPEAPYVVASLHRYENIFDEPRLRRIVAALAIVAERYTVAFIRHPATALQLDKHDLTPVLDANRRIRLYPRLGYLPFLQLVLGAEFVVTDGGGNQEELSYLGKPTLILRDETERREGMGETAVLARLDDESIEAFVDDYGQYARPISLPDVSPSEIIVDFLERERYGRR
jgi:UDP-N-acetylglucosamine 2-epimerase (non-hydrolysing)